MNKDEICAKIDKLFDEIYYELRGKVIHNGSDIEDKIDGVKYYIELLKGNKKIVYRNVDKFRLHIEDYGKGSLNKNEYYHVVTKNCKIGGIHCSYLQNYDGIILHLMNSDDSIIAEVKYNDIEEIMVCKDSFWNVLYVVYLKEGE